MAGARSLQPAEWLSMLRLNPDVVKLPAVMDAVQDAAEALQATAGMTTAQDMVAQLDLCSATLMSALSRGGWVPLAVVLS